MGTRDRRIAAIAALLLALGTVLGALGAHALETRLAPDRLEIYETAVRYHFFHALGLLAIGLTGNAGGIGATRAAVVLLLVGIALFCGSLYLLAFGAPRMLGMVAPFGGASLIVGWVLFAIGIWRARTSHG